MDSVLKECLDTICKERDTGWDASHDCVERLIAEIGESEFADKLFNSVSRSVPYEVVRDILNIAIWSTSDNGVGITESTNRWLQEMADTRKMLVALNLEVLPFSNEAQSREYLDNIPDELWIVRTDALRVVDSWSKVK